MSPRTYPGTNTSIDTDQPWDAAPRKIIMDGVLYNYFTIGHLAMALNKRPVTVRKWITMGVLPDARARLKVKGVAKGKGPRLWTRAQVEAIVRIAGEEGMLAPNSNRRNAAFTRRVEQWLDANKGR